MSHRTIASTWSSWWTRRLSSLWNIKQMISDSVSASTRNGLSVTSTLSDCTTYALRCGTISVTAPTCHLSFAARC